MRKHTPATWTRYALLAVMLLAVLPMLSGCFIQPDNTLDPLALDLASAQPLPFATSVPTPAPTDAPVSTEVAQAGTGNTAWEAWGNQAGAVAPTDTPKPSTWQTSTEDYNAGYPVLKLGSTGSDVSDMQERLRELSYYSGSVDGKFANGTQDAVMAFQNMNGIPADGVAGRETQDKLYSASAIPQQKQASSASSGKKSSSGSASTETLNVRSVSGLLKNGSQGTMVRMTQVRLAELGYYNGGADGLFGSSTASAVKAFQRNNNLQADGQAGEQTLDKLFSDNAKAAATPVKTANPNADRVMISGMEGNDVYSLQKRLIELRYLNGVPDAVFGVETEQAVRAFQENNGMQADGKAGPATVKKLNAKTAKPFTKATPTATPKPGNYVSLMEGDAGQSVYDMQARLYELCYYNGRIDGRFGPSTTASVVAFQRACGLDADGIAGPATQKKLFSDSAMMNPGVISGTGQVKATTAPNAASNTAPSTSMLSNGSSGLAVTQMQIQLSELGYYSGRIDGYYGPDTAEAVRAFQQGNGLGADAIAGEGTLTLLFSGKASAKASPQSTLKPDTTRMLEYGQKGDQVKLMQNRLYQLYYLDESSVTGDFGNKTLEAVKSFQQRNGLDPDGIAGPGTLVKLYSIYAEAMVAD